MTIRALVLSHDPDEHRRERAPGALLPALSTRDIKYDVASLVVGEEPDPADFDMLVVLGSSNSAYDDTVPWLAAEMALVGAAVERGLPTLGICFGGQLLARVLGGSVGPAALGEHGYTSVDTTDPDLVPRGPWMQFHSDAFIPPPGTEIARNESGCQAFTDGKVLGLQFHPETTVDSFDSWTRRWAADGVVPGAGLDIAGLRAEIARHERHTTILCDRLVGAFCARNLEDRR
jgi:GMP synthase (glutamine-hydrolysing)